MSIFENEKASPDSQLYFYAVVCRATEPQIGRIKKMLAAQEVTVIYQMTDLGYLWIQRGRPPEAKT